MIGKFQLQFAETCFISKPDRGFSHLVCDPHILLDDLMRENATDLRITENLAFIVIKDPLEARIISS